MKLVKIYLLALFLASGVLCASELTVDDILSGNISNNISILPSHDNEISKVENNSSPGQSSINDKAKVENIDSSHEISTNYSKASESPKLGTTENPIRVGVIDVAPFGSIKNGEFFGLTIEYWRDLAAMYGWKYEFINAGQNYGKAVLATKDGAYDVLLGNFSTYYERGKLVDFSRPYLLNYVSVLASTKNAENIFVTIAKVVIRLVLPIFLTVGCFLFLFALILSRSTELTEDRGFFINSFYVIMAILQGQVTYIDKPHCNSSRLVLVLMAFFSILFASTFTAVMTDTLLILDVPTDPFTKIKDVEDKHFVVEEGSGFVNIVKSLGGVVKEVPGSEASVEYYYKNRDKYDGWVADHALVHMYDKELPAHDVIQSGINMRNDELVFIYNKDFPFSKEVDLGILKLQDNNTSILICARYLGVDSKLCVV